MVLEGAQVRLRPLTREDMPRRLAISNDPEVQKSVTGILADANTELDMLSWFQMISEDPMSEQWAVEGPGGEYIGDIDLHSIHMIPEEAWISPMFGPPALHDAGLRKEALLLILRYAFGEKGVRTVRIDIPDKDELGVQVLEELGFEKVEAFEMEMFTGAQMFTYAVTPETLRDGPS